MIIKWASQNIASAELSGLSWDPPAKIGALLSSSSLLTAVIGIQWKCKFCEITCALWIVTLLHGNIAKKISIQNCVSHNI